MPHRTGSKPFRAIKWEKGGKEGNPPGPVEMFFHTRKKGEVIIERTSQDKYEELQEATRSDPSISEISLIEKCFGNQRKDNVITYGGGVRPKHLKKGEPSSSKQVELENRLIEAEHENLILKNRIESLEVTQKENDLLKRRMDALESAFSNVMRQNYCSGSNNSLSPFLDKSSEVQSPIVAGDVAKVKLTKKKKKRPKGYSVQQKFVEIGSDKSTSRKKKKKKAKRDDFDKGSPNDIEHAVGSEDFQEVHEDFLEVIDE